MVTDQPPGWGLSGASGPQCLHLVFSLQFADGVYLVLLMGLLEGYFVPLHSFFLTPDSFEQKVRGGDIKGGPQLVCPTNSPTRIPAGAMWEKRLRLHICPESSAVGCGAHSDEQLSWEGAFCRSLSIVNSSPFPLWSGPGPLAVRPCRVHSPASSPPRQNRNGGRKAGQT